VTARTGPGVTAGATQALTVAVLLAAMLSFAISQTMVILALPALAAHLHVDAGAASWALTATLLTASIAAPVAGRLGDVHGKRIVLIGCLGAFAAGSVLCALSHSLTLLIAGRAICGVGAGTIPLGFAIVRDTFAAERLNRAVGLLSTTFGIGMGLGLALSGVILDHLSLAWLFWPGALAAPTALAVALVVGRSAPTAPIGVDWGGATLLCSGIVAIVLAISRAQRWGWGAAPTVLLFVGGVGLLVLLWLAERHHPDPLIDIGLLRSRTVGCTNLAAWFIGLGLFSSYLLIPQIAQLPASTGYGLELSATRAGLLLVPSALAMLVMGPVTGRLGSTLGFAVLMRIGTITTAIGTGWLVLDHARAWQLASGGTVVGIGIGISFAAMVSLIVGAVPRDQIGVATAINTIVRMVGGVFGVALTTAIVSASATPSPSEGGYVAALAVGFAAALAASVLTLRLPEPTSWRST
jgi:MFS family permease